MAMSLVSTVTVGSGGASSIEWTNIPQSGIDLLVVISARTTQAAVSDNHLLQLNGSASDFSGIYLFSNFVSNLTGTDTRQAGAYAGADATASVFSNNELYFARYTSSSPKIWYVDSRSENLATQANIYVDSKKWNNNSAITSIYLSPTGGTYVEHSTASLYIIS